MRHRSPPPPAPDLLAVSNSSPKTLFEKVWNDHLVKDETAGTPAILYIDLHLIHEVTTPQAFALLREKGI
ncbi:MAG: hypothetical protein IIA09_07780, partial [Proteobacteria bacterium]|nr:hypothetical protein [Pseudomonadota bacterium]